jgi:hypothetical protein
MLAEEQVVTLARDVHVPIEHPGRRGLTVQARRNANHKVPPGVLPKLHTALIGARRARDHVSISKCHHKEQGSGTLSTLLSR